MYAKIVNGEVVKYPYTQADLVAQYPNSCVPVVWTDSFCAEENLVIVVQTGAPEHNSLIEIAEIVGAAYDSVNNRWVTNWSIRNKTAEEQTEFLDNLKNGISVATQDRLDSFARTRGYDDIKSATGYAGCSIAKYDIEGSYCRDIRAQTWDALFQILADALAGNRAIPTSYYDIEAELPQLVWPS